MLDVFRTHPINIVGSVLQENSFFTPADEFLGELQQRPTQTERSLSNLQARVHGSEAEPSGMSQLRCTIRDLVSTLVFPASWRGSDMRSIVDSLLDMLTGLAQLEFAFVSLATKQAGSQAYFYKASIADRSIAPQELARLLEGQIRERRPTVIANPFGQSTLRAISLALGVNDKWGTVVAASPHDHFPTQTEMLLLTVAINQAVLALEDTHTRTLEADKLRLEAEQLRTAADLAQLRAHLQPHFLLNTLNAIAGLVTADPGEARRLLVCLGDLLRDSFRDDDEMQTLDEQIERLHCYAEIVQARYAGRLVFRWQIANEARAVLVPRLLLQSLVENAVKHGTLRRSGGGEVIVQAKLEEAMGTPASKLVCTIEDNGPGVPEAETRAGAFGLFAVRRRLALKYGDKSNLRLESSSSGTRCTVELPAQKANAKDRAS